MPTDSESIGGLWIAGIGGSLLFAAYFDLFFYKTIKSFMLSLRP